MSPMPCRTTVEGRSCEGGAVEGLQDVGDRRGTLLWGATAEGLRAVVFGYCHSIGRSRVSLCSGLQGVAPRVI